MAQGTIKVYDAIRRSRRLLPGDARPTLDRLDNSALWTLAILVCIMADVGPVDLGFGVDSIVKGKVKPAGAQFPGIVQGAKMAAAAGDDPALWAAAAVIARGIQDAGPSKVGALTTAPDFKTVQGIILGKLAVPQVADPPLPAVAAPPAPAAPPAVAETPAPPAPAVPPKKGPPPKVKTPAPPGAPPPSAPPADPADEEPAAAPPPAAAPGDEVSSLDRMTADQMVAESKIGGGDIAPPSPEVRLELVGGVEANTYTGPTEAPPAGAPPPALAPGWQIQESVGGRKVLAPVPRRLAPPAAPPSVPDAPTAGGAAAAVAAAGAVALLLALAMLAKAAARPVVVEDARAR